MAGFELEQVSGNVSELQTSLKEVPLHEREEKVIPVIQEAIAKIVEAIGGYLSVSCNGNLNPVAGDTGDVVEIYITSLPEPTKSVEPETPLPAAPAPEVTEAEVPVEEKPVEGESAHSEATPEPVLAAESAQENTEIPPATIPPAEETKVVENSPASVPQESVPSA